MLRACQTFILKAHHMWNDQRPWPSRQRCRWIRSTFRYFAILIMTCVDVQQCLIPFARASCDAKSDNDNSQQQDKAKSTELGLISRLLAKMQGGLLLADGEKNQRQQSSGGSYPKRHPHRQSFRDVTIREYENRLRMHSRPDKIFRYFATIKTKNAAGQWEVYMTPHDFLRSMMPGFRQPVNLGLDQFRKMDRGKAQKLTSQDIAKDSIFYKFRPDGLLTFGDYLYLLMLMSLPERHFEIGFTLFDQQGSGNLSKEDMHLLLLGITADEHYKNNTFLSHYFFGPELDQKLSLQKFLEFKRQLHQDVLLLEFKLLQRKRKQTEEYEQKSNDTISELSFAKVLLTYAMIPTRQKVETLERIKEKYKQFGRGITLDEFISFFKFIQYLPDIDTALTYHYLAGADISRRTLKHISDVVVGVSLSPHVIDIIFTVFDSDSNGILGRNEFIEALRHRMLRCKQNSLKLSHLYGSVLKCAKETLIV